MRRIATIALFAVALAPTVHAQNPDIAQKLTGFDAYMEKLLKDWNAPGIGVGVVVIALVVLGVIGYVLSPKHGGQVIFTTDAPTASGAATCDLGNQVTTVTTGTPVYANFFYKSRLTGETVTLTIIKDGSVLDTSTLTADQSNGVDCVESNANLGDLAPGVYEFKLTSSKGDVVSDGTLTIK